MSVIWPVPQVEMWPYVDSATLGLLSHASLAVMSSALLVKMYECVGRAVGAGLGCAQSCLI